MQGGTDKIKGYLPNASRTAQCISARDIDCVSRIPFVQRQGKLLYKHGKVLLGPRIDDVNTYFGKWSQLSEENGLAKKYSFIAKVSKLKDMEAIPLMDNAWVLTWTLGRSKAVDAVEPAVVLTHVGANKPFIFRASYGDRHTLLAGKRPGSDLSAKQLERAVRIHSGDEIISHITAYGETWPTYRYSAWLELDARDAAAIKAVHYIFDDETFKNPKRGTENGDRFQTSWIGWGCAYQAHVVAILVDGSRVTGHFDMCEIESS